MKNGCMIVSLDFELMWGIRDKRGIQEYGTNILGVRWAIPKILEEFSKKNIHCTWATVGLLFNNNKNEIISFLPNEKPNYQNENLSPYKYIDDIGNDEDNDKYHFAISLIKLILRNKYQEIGSHTFSHYYCLEEGQTKEEFADDIVAAKKIARKYGIEIKSLVLPRNQTNMNYMDILINNNLLSFRGNEKSWINKAAKGSDEKLFKRMCRLIDSYINLSGHNCYVPNDIIIDNNLLNIRSSRFLRPYSKKLRFFEDIKIHRIKSQMKYAAKHNMIFHIWWHPHNFGVNINENMNNLRKILDYYIYLNKKYGFESKNMSELAEEILQK